MTPALLIIAALLLAGALSIHPLHVGARRLLADRRDEAWRRRFSADLAKTAADPTLRIPHPDWEVTG